MSASSTSTNPSRSTTASGERARHDRDESRRAHFQAHFPGVNSTTVWSDPESGSQIDFDSFERFARTAERGLFDTVFLAEGLRLREQHGRIHELDVAGRPNTVAILAALAAITTRIGLAGTLTATFNEPGDLARQLATLDVLSNGRAAWNVVTTPDAFTGANFRRGGYLPFAERYERAREFVEVARAHWNSWAPDAVVGDAVGGRYLSDDPFRPVAHAGKHFDVRGVLPVPPSPQGHPVIIQAGDHEEGRELAAAQAEIVFTGHAGLEAGRAFYRDVKGRLARYGRAEDDLKILPAATFAIGDTPDEARERAHAIGRQQISPQTAIAFLEQIWARDLSDFDVDGPLPAEEPDLDAAIVTAGRTQGRYDRRERAEQLRELAAREGLSARDLVVRLHAQPRFIGTPRDIALDIRDAVQTRSADGFTLVGHLTPGGLDEFVDRVVPELQELGVYRTAYPEGGTLRDLLGVKSAGVSYGGRRTRTDSAGERERDRLRFAAAVVAGAADARDDGAPSIARGRARDTAAA